MYVFFVCTINHCIRTEWLTFFFYFSFTNLHAWTYGVLTSTSLFKESEFENEKTWAIHAIVTYLHFSTTNQTCKNLTLSKLGFLSSLGVYNIEFLKREGRRGRMKRKGESWSFIILSDNYQTTLMLYVLFKHKLNDITV